LRRRFMKEDPNEQHEPATAFRTGLKIDQWAAEQIG
jgi:hypothetical protein